MFYGQEGPVMGTRATMRLREREKSHTERILTQNHSEKSLSAYEQLVQGRVLQDSSRSVIWAAPPDDAEHVCQLARVQASRWKVMRRRSGQSIVLWSIRTIGLLSYITLSHKQQVTLGDFMDFEIRFFSVQPETSKPLRRRVHNDTSEAI